MSIKGNTDSIVVRFHSWIFIQSEESSDANTKLFKEDDDEAMYKNLCEIRLCDLISVSLYFIILGFPCCRSDAKRLTVWDKNDCVLLFFSRCTMLVEAAQTAELRELVKSSPRLSKISHFHLSYHSWIVLK